MLGWRPAGLLAHLWKATSRTTRCASSSLANARLIFFSTNSEPECRSRTCSATA
jgi:hypothetical protein